MSSEFVRLSVATKGAHGIEAERPPGRQPSGQSGGEGEQHDGGKIGSRIEAADPVKYAAENVGQAGGPADAQH